MIIIIIIKLNDSMFHNSTIPQFSNLGPAECAERLNPVTPAQREEGRVRCEVRASARIKRLQGPRAFRRATWRTVEGWVTNTLRTLCGRLFFDQFSILISNFQLCCYMLAIFSNFRPIFDQFSINFFTKI